MNSVDINQDAGQAGNADLNAMVVASHDGTVRAKDDGNEGYGKWVEIVGIVDGITTTTRYGHLHDFGPGIAPGTSITVNQGQIVGYVGTTGESTGEHLHYEVRQGSDVLDASDEGNLFSFYKGTISAGGIVPGALSSTWADAGETVSLDLYGFDWNEEVLVSIVDSAGQTVGAPVEIVTNTDKLQPTAIQLTAPAQAGQYQIVAVEQDIEPSSAYTPVTPSFQGQSVPFTLHVNPSPDSEPADETGPIVWVNREGPTQQLVCRDAACTPGMAYYTFTNAERAVIDEAVRLWNQVLVGLPGVSEIQVTFTGGSHGDQNVSDDRGTPDPTDDIQLSAKTIVPHPTFEPTFAEGLPRKADIIIDNNAGGRGWFVDPTPDQNEEFPILGAKYYLSGNPDQRVDLLSVALHEIGHALGYSIFFKMFRDDVTPVGPYNGLCLAQNPVGLRTYTGDGTTATLTTCPATHFDFASHSHDLMNDQDRDPENGQPGLAAGDRVLVSDLDAAILADAYGYQFVEPPRSDTEVGVRITTLEAELDELGKRITEAATDAERQAITTRIDAIRNNIRQLKELDEEVPEGVPELNHPKTQEEAPALNVVQIIIDGLKRDVLDDYLSRMGADGILAALAKPDSTKANPITFSKTATVFPSYTFAAQASLITGVSPGTHGIAGNEYFVRSTADPEVFDAEAALTLSDVLGAYGYDLGHLGPELSRNSVVRNGLANRDLQSSTIYEPLNGITTLVAHHMYWTGADYYLRPSGDDLLLYAGNQSEAYDTAMVDKVVDFLGTHTVPRLMTLYFAGLDHESHIRDGLVDDKQRTFLSNVIDPQLERLRRILDKKGVLDSTVFVVTSDHGHTEVVRDDAHAIEIETAADQELEEVVEDVDGYDVFDNAAEANFTAFVGLNGGMSSIYLQNRQTHNWNDLPRLNEDVWPVVQSIQDHRKHDGLWDLNAELCETGVDAIEEVLVRDVRDGNKYKVFRDAPVSGYTAEPWQDGYLLELSALTMLRPDYVRAAERITAYQNPGRSGDIVLLPKFMNGYYFSSPQAATHGSLYADDSYIPFVIGGAPVQDGRIVSTYGLDSPTSVLDVAPTIAAILGYELPGSQGQTRVTVIGRELTRTTSLVRAVDPIADGGGSVRWASGDNLSRDDTISIPGLVITNPVHVSDLSEIIPVGDTNGSVIESGIVETFGTPIASEEVATKQRSNVQILEISVLDSRVVITGTAIGDEILITFLDQTMILKNVFSGETHSVNIAEDTTVEVFLGDGDDTLIIQVPEIGLPIYLQYDGGTQVSMTGDVLELRGASTPTASYLPNLDRYGCGTLRIGQGTLAFTGLEPVTVSGISEFTFVAPGSNDALVIDSDPNVAVPNNRISGTSGNTPFESLTFYDVAHFAIDMASNDSELDDPNDSLFIATDLAARGLQSFTVNAGIGDDQVDAGAVLSRSVTIYGGHGDDVLTGGARADRIDGGRGRDTIDGRRGNDQLLGGEDADTFKSSAGDDSIDGGGGTDTYVFFGTAGDDLLLVNAQGAEIIVTDVGSGKHDAIIGTEQIRIDTGDSVAGGLPDTVTVNSLLGTDAQVVEVLASAIDFNRDRLIVNGTDEDESIVLGEDPGSGALRVFGLRTAIIGRDFFLQDGDTVEVNGLAGNDVLRVEPTVGVDLLIELRGGDGDDVIEGGAGNDVLSGGNGNDTIAGGGGVDAVSGDAGGDTILVQGTDEAETIIVQPNGTFLQTTDANGLTSFIDIATAGIEHVLVEAGAGSDDISARPLGQISVHVDGGQPTDSFPGDTLTIISDGTTSGYQANGSGDSGSLDFGGNAPVSFERIEGLSISNAGEVTLSGSDDDDQITVFGTGPDSILASVNGGLPLPLAGITSLRIDARGGDDDVDIELNELAIPIFEVFGGLPGAESDTVTIRGEQGAFDDPTFSPSDIDEASFATINGQVVNLQAVERFIYDGKGDGEFVTVSGTAGQNSIVHQPGRSIDSGSVQVDSLLTLEYVAIGPAGTVIADGADGTDTLTMLGTRGSDRVFVEFPAQNSASAILLRAEGTHLGVQSGDVENYRVETLEGDDVVSVGAPVEITGSLVVVGGGNGIAESDRLEVIGANGDPIRIDLAARQVLGLGGPINYSGIEHVAIDAGLADVGFEATTGNDRLTFTPMGADAGILQIAGFNTDFMVTEVAALAIAGLDGDDELRVVATPADDLLTLTNRVATVDGLQSTLYDQFESIVVDGSGGNDLLTVDNTDGLLTTPVTFSGSDGTNRVNLIGNTAIAGSTYTPGTANDEGLVVHALGAATQRVYFAQVVSVMDLVAATKLTILGNNAVNDFTYEQGSALDVGLLSVDAFPPIEFANKTTLTINALAGSDVVHLNNGKATPTGLTGIVVNGGDPMASDTLIVNGLAAAMVAVSHTGADEGTITGAEPVTVTFDTLEHLTVNAQTSTRLAVSGSATFTVNPGVEADQGEVLSTGVPISFDGYGSGEFLRLTGGGVGSDVTVNGTAAKDLFTVAVAGAVDTVTITGRATVETASLPTATLNGFDGDDRFVVNGNAAFTYTALNLHGGDGDQDDLAALNAATGDVVVDLGNATIAGYGVTVINYTGLRTVAADANEKLLTVKATSGDDETVVTPATATSGLVTNNGVNPVVLYSKVPAVTGVIIDQLTGGEDTLIVNATNGADTITVDLSGAAPFVNTGTLGGRVQFDSDTEAVTVCGLAGNDTFHVVSGPIPVFVDGGDPVGEAGDALHVTADTSVLAVPGPERDAGGFTLDGNERVSYDQIEAVSVTDSASPGGLAVTVVGTNGDDDLTLIGVGSQAFTVSVNDGLEVLYQGAATAQLEGHSGDDDIEGDLNDAAFTDVTITVLGGDAGGDPSTDSDVLTVAAVDGPANAVNWTPTSADDGKLTVTGVPEIAVTDVEDLIYDGESDNEMLTVTGAGRFVHVPGANVDAGSLQLDSQLRIRYLHLGVAGTVTANGTGGGDMLAAWASDGSDVIAATFTGSNAIEVDITSALGTHVDLLSTGVESYEIRAGLGDDDINLVPTAGVAPLLGASGTFHVFGDGDGTRDTLRINGAAITEVVSIAPDTTDPDDQDIVGLGTRIDVTGIELLRYAGAGSDDTLTVNPGSGDNVVRVEAAHPASWDGVTSDSLPVIEFTALKTFAVDAAVNGGADVVTFATRALGGAVPGNYQLAGGATDTLVIEGADGMADLYTATNPAGTPSVAVSDGTVTVTETAGTLGRLQVNTLGGDDQLDVNNSTGLITLPSGIGFDGGAGSDLLRLLGSTVVTDSTYHVGPLADAGAVVHTAAAGTQTVFFRGLEPVIDIVAGPLTVHATDANNAIDYRVGPNSGGALVGGVDSGLVSIDGFEDLEFANKTTLTVNALAGDDVVNLNNPTTPKGLTSIVVNGNDGDDRVTTRSGTPVDVTMNGDAGFDFLDASGLTGAAVATIEGGDGDDVLVGSSQIDTLRGGRGEDTIISGDGADFVDGGADFDVLVVSGTPGDNRILVFQTAPSSVIDAGYELQVLLDGNDLGNDVLAQTLAGVPPTAPGSAPTVEEVRIEAGRGNDLIQVGHADAYSDGDDGNGLPGQMVRFYVLGDAPNASDRLVVTDDGPGDLVLVRQSPDERSGRVTVAPDVNNGPGEVVYEGIERLDVTPHDPVTGGTGADGLGRIVVFQPDPFELNDDRLNPTDVQDVLSQHRDPTIDPGGVSDPFGWDDILGDEDWYEFRSPKIGTFRFDVLFTEIAQLANGREGLPGDGALDTAVYDAAGNLIVLGTPTAGGEQTTFSAAAGKNYYLRVRGATAPAINTYDVRLTEVDLVGPQLFDPDGMGPLSPVHITENTATTWAESVYDLFDPKPSAGPTPRVDSLTLHFRDLVSLDQLGRAPGDIYPALDALIAARDGRYAVVGDHSGRIAIASIAVTNNPLTFAPGTVQAGATATSFAGGAGLSPVDDFYTGQILLFAAADGGPLAGQARLVSDYAGATRTFTLASGFSAAPAAGATFQVLPMATASVELRFAAPLPDDRYTLTVGDTLLDPAGNLSDGENNAAEPQDHPQYPTGDGVAGGDFVARFTVDSRPEFGTVCCGGVYVDINGDFVFDPEGRLQDAVNRDLVFRFGETTDGLFAGNFAAAGAASASGFDKLGAYGYVTGKYRFLLDLDHDGVADFSSISGVQVNAIPVAGDFAAGHPGDEIGIFDGTRWHLDSDGDNVLEAADTTIDSQLRGLPVVGNFGGSSADDLATLDVNTNTVSFDLNRDGVVDDTLVFPLPGWVERILAGDVNLDGIDDLVFWVPGRDGQPADEAAEWYVLVSDRPGTGLPSFVFEAFSPAPLGNDLFALFGDQSALPIFGNFDPPVSGAGLPYIPHTNPAAAWDVNNDGMVTPVDALLLINQLNTSGTHPLVGSAMIVGPFYDPSGDGTLSPVDVLAVINWLNSQTGAAAEGESGATANMLGEGGTAWYPGAEYPGTGAGVTVDADRTGSASQAKLPAAAPADAGRVTGLDSAVWAVLRSDDTPAARRDRIRAAVLADVQGAELEQDWDSLLTMLADDFVR
jgi:predicted AlkP superfamily pyrophosphatase or phosphodiesterase/Ca2+-binding RTX toxin-like protein